MNTLILLAPSRKGFIGAMLNDCPPDQRDEGTVAACITGLIQGIDMVRVHNVDMHKKCIDRSGCLAERRVLMDKIVLKIWAFAGIMGTWNRKTVRASVFFVDVTILIDLTKAGQSDDLADSINYVEVYNTVERVVTGEPQKLLEKVGTLIADELWNNYRGIIGLAVAIRKPAVPIPGMLDYAEITITRGQM